MSIKLVIRGSFWNIISVYALHVRLDDEEKKRFLKDLNEMVRGVPSNEKLFIRGDFNGHIGSHSRGYDDVHGGHGFGVRNIEGVALLDFAQAFGLVVVNLNFPKKEVHLVTFYSSVSKTQIDFLLLKKGDRDIFKDCKVLPRRQLEMCWAQEAARASTKGTGGGMRRYIKFEEVKGAICRMHRGRAAGPDEIPVDFWKCIGGEGIKWLTRLFNIIFKMERMPDTKWS
ncbi:craniofacial development protein 2-like [Capsicum annuum]|uniref:craniofacial development protein 2-like n=1 Tax=Capsicum annuum TaxID=4072 RepID=UPI001FB0BBFB|nr:craniofacial development protein 2-like [Capsicum annuum]